MASIRKRKFGPNKDQEAWVVDYVDQHGKRRLKTFSTKKDAEAWRTNALHEIQQGVHTAASVSKTVEEVWQLWISDCESAASQTSRCAIHWSAKTGRTDSASRL